MIRRGFVVLTVGSVILGVLAGPAHATEDYSRTIAAGRAVVTQSLKDTDATSISVALMSDGKVVWSQGFVRSPPLAGSRSRTRGTASARSARPSRQWL